MKYFPPFPPLQCLHIKFLVTWWSDDLFKKIKLLKYIEAINDWIIKQID